MQTKEKIIFLLGGLLIKPDLSQSIEIRVKLSIGGSSQVRSQSAGLDFNIYGVLLNL